LIPVEMQSKGLSRPFRRTSITFGTTRRMPRMANIAPVVGECDCRVRSSRRSDDGESGPLCGHCVRSRRCCRQWFLRVRSSLTGPDLDVHVEPVSPPLQFVRIRRKWRRCPRSDLPQMHNIEFLAIPEQQPAPETPLFLSTCLGALCPSCQNPAPDPSAPSVKGFASLQ